MHTTGVPSSYKSIFLATESFFGNFFFLFESRLIGFLLRSGNHFFNRMFWIIISWFLKNFAVYPEHLVWRQRIHLGQQRSWVRAYRGPVFFLTGNIPFQKIAGLLFVCLCLIGLVAPLKIFLPYVAFVAAVFYAFIYCGIFSAYMISAYILSVY